MSRSFCLVRTEARGAKSSARAIKKRDRQRGDKRAVSHFQTRDGGFGGMGRPYPVALI